MKPHPRIRKAIKWGGAVVTVLLVAVWIGSGWYVWQWASATGWCVLHEGRVELSWDSEFSKDLGFRSGPFFPLNYRWGFDLDVLANRRVVAPLWAPVCVVGAATILARRFDTLARSRARLNLCPKCNYDRTGLAIGAVCPECGSVPSAHV